MNIDHESNGIHTSDTEKLFSYGTLRYDSVQIATFGRKLNGVPDVLVGYRLTMLQISDDNVVNTSGSAMHPIITYTGNKDHIVNGMVFDITQLELENADKYEVSDYTRVDAKLKSGINAWVYISKI